MIVLCMISALAFGLLYGLSGIEITLVELISKNTDIILYVLMFFIGISIGMQKDIFLK